MTNNSEALRVEERFSKAFIAENFSSVVSAIKEFILANDDVEASRCLDVLILTGTPKKEK